MSENRRTSDSFEQEMKQAYDHTKDGARTASDTFKKGKDGVKEIKDLKNNLKNSQNPGRNSANLGKKSLPDAKSSVGRGTKAKGVRRPQATTPKSPTNSLSKASKSVANKTLGGGSKSSVASGKAIKGATTGVKGITKGSAMTAKAGAKGAAGGAKGAAVAAKGAALAAKGGVVAVKVATKATAGAVKAIAATGPIGIIVAAVAIVLIAVVILFSALLGGSGTVDRGDLPEMITDEMLIAVMRTRDEYDVPASFRLAQIIQESRGSYPGGLSLLAYRYYNLFGIKGTGPAGTVNMLTWEHYDGVDGMHTYGFRVYHNHTESVEDNARLLSNPDWLYYPATRGIDWRTVEGARDFARAVGPIYATDPAYITNKIWQMDNLDLYRFDTMPFGEGWFEGGEMGEGVTFFGDLAYPTVMSKVVVTSEFGWRDDPISGERQFHGGIDLGGPLDTPIFAIASGTVTTSGFSSSAGWWIVIQHDNGLVSRYMHHNKNLVRVGERVTRGQKIALMGTTGWSTGVHLHFEIIRNGEARNPREFFDF